MRIGIVTQPLINNYGGVLQNFALQTVLKKIGHEPITLDYIPYKSLFRVLMSLLLNVILYFTPKRRLFKECFPIKRDKKIELFLRKNVKKSSVLHDYYSELIKEYQLDAVIVGSDQVWRPIYNSGVLYHMFLDFTFGTDVKRIAYAASFGVSSNEYKDYEAAECSRLVRQFDGVSVRESSGIEMCEKLFNIEAQIVLDPTLLLNANDYPIQPCKKSNGGYLLSYILNHTKAKELFLDSASNALSLGRVGIEISDNLKFSVEKWLGFFKDADFIITDSFHGTVFSIIYHKRFLVLDNKGRGSSRLLSLLELLGLEFLLVSDINEPVSSLISRCVNVNWNSVDYIIETERRKSVDFLLNHL